MKAYHLSPLRAASALFKLGIRPDRLDAILDLGEALNHRAYSKMVQRFAEHPEGRIILEERPILNSSRVDFDALARLPSGSLGFEYVTFLRAHSITPDVFELPKSESEPLLAYLMLRIRQTHEIWHVLTGYPIDPAGEITLEAFSYPQLATPSGALIALTGWIRYGVDPRRMLRAYRRGRRAAYLAAIYWEHRWTHSLSSLRGELRIPPP